MNYNDYTFKRTFSGRRLSLSQLRAISYSYSEKKAEAVDSELKALKVDLLYGKQKRYKTKSGFLKAVKRYNEKIWFDAMNIRDNWKHNLQANEQERFNAYDKQLLNLSMLYDKHDAEVKKAKRLAKKGHK
jgi:hypothetical protein